MGRPRKDTSVEEPTSYAEIGTYLHRDKSHAKVKSYVSCNEPLKVDASEDTKQIQKLRVEVRVKEDNGVKGNQFYEKDVETVQINDGGDSQPTTQTNSTETGLDNIDPQSGGLSPLKVLKNFVDNVASDNRYQWLTIAAIGLVGALALGIALFK